MRPLLCGNRPAWRARDNDPRGDLPRLVRYALGTGLKAYVYSNLVHVTPPLWDRTCRRLEGEDLVLSFIDTDNPAADL